MNIRVVDPIPLDLDLQQFIRKVEFKQEDGTLLVQYLQYDDEYEFLMLVRPFFKQSYGIRHYIDDRIKELRECQLIESSQTQTEKS